MINEKNIVVEVVVKEEEVAENNVDGFNESGRLNLRIISWK